MPLRCIDSLTGKSVIAFDLDDGAWDVLSASNRRERHLRTVCCGTKVALKRSAWKTKYFAHMPNYRCKAPSESEAHLRLKQLAVEVAREYGWEALTEVAGDGWRADVLARKGKFLVGIEVQWSRQKCDVTHQRQDKLKQAGIRCLWLFAQSDFPISEDLPAARIVTDSERQYIAVIPNSYGEQRIKAREFIANTFAGRFHFGFPVGLTAPATLSAVEHTCPNCGKLTSILRTLTVRSPTSKAMITIADLDAYPEEARQLVEEVRKSVRMGFFDRRYDTSDNANRTQNTCAHCGTLLGRLRQYQKTIGDDFGFNLDICITEGWRQLLSRAAGAELFWGVY